MALFNEILSGRFNRFAQKALSMKGPPALPTLSQDLQIALPWRVGNEDDYLRSVDWFGLSVANAANAAGFFGFRLTNPLNSGIIAVIKRMRFRTTIADGASIEAAYNLAPPTFYAVQNQGSALDGRLKRQSTCTYSLTNAATTGVSLGAGAIDFYATAAGVDNFWLQDIDQGIVLTPASALNVFGSTNNAVCFSSIWWTERVLEDSEKF